MKKTFLLLSLFFSLAVSAQTDSAGSRLQFKMGMNYNSNLHYYGRTDSLQSSGFFPMAELWINNKFYLSAAPIFVHNKFTGTDYAGSVATAGFLNLTSGSMLHLYALKPFYTAESRLVQSAMKAQAGAAFSLLSKFVNLGIGGDVKYSNQPDYGATASLDHVVRWQKDAGLLILNPTVTLNAGTQNFLRNFRQKKGLLLPREEQVTQRQQVFRLLAWEASLPLIFIRGKVQVLATPAYVVPLNLQPAQGATPAEYGKPLFYTTVGVKYSL